MQSHTNSRPDLPESLRSLLVNFLRVTFLLGGAIGFAYCYLSLTPDYEPLWSPVATTRPTQYHPNLTMEYTASNDHREEVLAKFFPSATDERQADRLSPATCSIEPALQDRLLVEHWFDVSTETVWDAAAEYSPQSNLHVVGFHLGDEHYCFARVGLLSIYDSVYSFSVGAKQVAVTYWALKDRLRVLVRSSDKPVDWGIVGMTNDEELVVSIDGECFQHDATLPFDNIEFEETTLASWTARFPDTQFCPCRVESL